jgi:hypothetical protein
MELPDIYSLLTISSYGGGGGSRMPVEYVTKFFYSKEKAEEDLRSQMAKHYAQYFEEYKQEYHHHLTFHLEDGESEDGLLKKDPADHTQYTESELEDFEDFFSERIQEDEFWEVDIKPFEYKLELIKVE